MIKYLIPSKDPCNDIGDAIIFPTTLILQNN
jgi:hypothetical protein